MYRRAFGEFGEACRLLELTRYLNPLYRHVKCWSIMMSMILEAMVKGKCQDLACSRLIGLIFVIHLPSAQRHQEGSRSMTLRVNKEKSIAIGRDLRTLRILDEQKRILYHNVLYITIAVTALAARRTWRNSISSTTPKPHPARGRP